jgi:hypothetical protein
LIKGQRPYIVRNFLSEQKNYNRSKKSIMGAKNSFFCGSVKKRRACHGDENRLRRISSPLGFEKKRISLEVH